MTDSPNIAIRLGVVGDKEVEASFDRVATSGDANVKRLAASWQRAGAEADSAAQRQAAAAQRLATALNVSTPGVKVGADQDAQIKAYRAAMADAQRQAEALRNAIDPLRVAQAAYDRELAAANSLLKSGNINQAEHAAAVTLATRSFDKAKQSLGGVEAAHGRVSASGMILQHVVRSTSDSFAAGLPVTMILGEQLSRLAEAAALSGGGEGQGKGALGTLAAFMAGPWGLAFTIGISVLANFIPKLFETSDAAKEAEKQLKAFEERQADMGRFIDANTGRLKEQNRELALIARMQLPAQISSQAGTTQGYVNQAFAAARGALSGMPGSDLLGRALLNKAITDSGSNVQNLRRNVAAVAKDHPVFADLANQVSGFAGQAAEAAMQIKTLEGHQRDLNTALSGGTVVSTALIDRQVALATAQNGVERAQQRLNDVKAEGEAIDKMDASDAKTRALAKYRQELTAATRALQQAQAAKKADAKADRESAADARKAAAERAALLKGLAANNFGPDIKRMAGEASKIFDAQFSIEPQLDARQGDRLAVGADLVRQDQAQRNALAMSQAELTTLGMSAEKRQMVLDLLTKTNQLQSDNVDLDSEQAQQLLRGVVAQDQMNALLAKASTAMQEVRDFGGQLVDDLASGRSITKDLVAEFIKLAAINPLKNMINGNSALPTLTGAIGSIGSLLNRGGISGSSASYWASQNSAFFAAHNAAGTDYFGGGMTWLAENGPELVRLPRGSKVSPASQTRQMMAANNNGGNVHHWHLEGAVVTQDLLDQMNQIGANAATMGANGGRSLAGADMSRRVSRRMR